MAGSLETYHAKRDFAGTPEPEGAVHDTAADAPTFVIHEHHASSMHWDLRLEHDGVLASWAVPKGLPDTPGKNHLAIHVEDHPLEYASFHGTIAEGHYGAGTVEIWDEGTYAFEKFRTNEVIFTLHGTKPEAGNTRGTKFALIQTKGKQWLLHRMSPPVDPDRVDPPAHVKPMLAKLAPMPTGDDVAKWQYEVKWDGIRAVAYVDGGRVQFESRTQRVITSGYPELREFGRALSSHDAVFDGEIVAFGEDGLPSFQRLQGRINLSSESTIRSVKDDIPVTYVIFDLLYLDGRDLTGLPLSERRDILDGLALTGAHWQTPAAYSDGDALFASTRERGMEGIVAKRLDSEYRPGSRNGAWIKVKHNAAQELIICGWISGAGSRADSFGALLLGYYDRRPAADGEQRLIYAGSVGTGFNTKQRAAILSQLKHAERKTSPFDEGGPAAGDKKAVTKWAAIRSHGAEARDVFFTTPKLVAQLQFTEWTRDGTLRHPSFQGLRGDKDPREVVREDQA